MREAGGAVGAEVLFEPPVLDGAQDLADARAGRHAEVEQVVSAEGQGRGLPGRRRLQGGMQLRSGRGCRLGRGETHEVGVVPGAHAVDVAAAQAAMASASAGGRP